MILFPLFVLLKSALVRHDTGHVLQACPTVVGLAAVLLPGRLSRWEFRSIQGLVAASLLGCWAWFSPPSPSTVISSSASSMDSLWHLQETRATLRMKDGEVKNSLKLPQAFLSRIGSDSVDVYPWDISYVTANRLNWKPRFVLQSYAAYTAELDRKCADNYREENAPRYILYSHKALPIMHPCIVDVQTRMEIYRWYKVVDQADDMLLLQHRDSPRWNRSDELGSKWISFGERWEVPEVVQGPVSLRASLRLNLVGKLYRMLYKVYPPKIRVEYRDGQVMDYCLAWQNVKSGFLVSSLPRDLNTQRRFFDGGEAEADGVRSVTFLNDNGCFVKGFHVTWRCFRHGSEGSSSHSAASAEREIFSPPLGDGLSPAAVD